MNYHVTHQTACGSESDWRTLRVYNFHLAADWFRHLHLSFCAGDEEQDVRPDCEPILLGWRGTQRSRGLKSKGAGSRIIVR